MKFFQTLITILFVSFILFSCHNKDYKKELMQLDSLQLQLNNIEKELFSMDTTKIVKYYREATSNLLYIQRNYRDTLDLQTGMFLSHYNSNKKVLNTLFKDFENAVDELLYSKGQIIDLIKDTENEIITKENFTTYYQSEKNAVHQLNLYIINLSKKSENAIKQFEEENPKIQEIINNIPPLTVSH